MNTPQHLNARRRLHAALAASDSSARLRAALAAGTHPATDQVEILLRQCAIEPDFYVRDTLTWSLTRHPAEITVPLLLAEAKSEVNQARSQALHTLSKIGDPRGWAAITPEVLRDPDDQVARSAWRAAVILVPKGAEEQLAQDLCSQLGRGERDVRLSLSRALAALGDAAEPVLREAATHQDTEVRVHAVATERLVRDPDESFDAAVFEAARIVALMNVPTESGDFSDGQA